MILSHFTPKQIIFEKDKLYIQDDLYKPTGLWLSDESVPDSWSQWCIENRFEIQNLRYKTDFEVDMSSVLHINNEKTLSTFEIAYGLPLFTGAQHEWASKKIYWPNVAAKYKGIIITPYLWECRLTRFWYYGWDCAGGCIWDLSALSFLSCKKSTLEVLRGSLHQSSRR